MLDQCIVCLDNLDTAVPLQEAPPDGLKTPTSGGVEGPGTRLVVVVAEASTSSGTSKPNSADEPTPGKSDNHHEIAVIQVCGHTLHNSCLQEWAGKANSCPICRQVFHSVNVYDKVGGKLISQYQVEDKKQVAEFDPQTWMEENPEEAEEEATPCPICGTASDEDVLLLCDGCDASYHTYCIGLDEVPDGSWFCMECAELFGDATELGPPPRQRIARAAASNRRTTDFFPRTQASMRRARRRARSDEWQGAWGEITGRIFDALEIDLDSHDGDDALADYRRLRQNREREQREYDRWQQRLNIARRVGAQDVFARSIPSALLQQPGAPEQRQQSTSTPESREERRAWGALERARECNGEGSSNRKRKTRSITGSPAEPPPEPERRLKRPRTRRIGVAAPAPPSEGSSSKSPSRANQRPEAERKPGPSNNARSPVNEDVPSFLSSLLQEVEQSSTSDNEAIRSLFGDNRVFVDPSSPGSSPSASAHNSPRALSITPPPQQGSRGGGRPSSPPTMSPAMSLSSHIEPVYPPANFLSNRSGGDNSDSESRPSNNNHSDSELRQPRPRRSQAVRLPRSPDASPTRTPLPFEMKENISSIVRSALKPHWKSSKLTAEQYASINRDVSRKIYDEVADPAAVDDETRQAWEKVASQEVARAVASLQA